MLVPQIKKAGKDKLLLMMEAGYLLHMAGKHEDSNRILEMAAKIAQVIPISVTQEAAALIADQTITNYRGEDFEKVLIHMFLGINYLSLNSPDDAAVEFKAVNNELQKIKNEKGEARYKQNIMAKYLAAIAHELRADTTGSEDDREYAEVEYKQILQLKPGMATARADLAQLQRSKKTDPTGELVVIFQAGRCPIKVSRGRLLDEPGMNAAIVATLATRSLAAGDRRCRNEHHRPGGKPYPEIQNPDKQDKVTQGDRHEPDNRDGSPREHRIHRHQEPGGRLRAAPRRGRCVHCDKGPYIAGSRHRRARGDTAAFQGKQRPVRAHGTHRGSRDRYGALRHHKPDLRCWHTLPANLQLARMRLLPGKYTAAVQYIGFNGAVQETKYLNFEIKRKDKYFVNIRTVEVPAPGQHRTRGRL